MNRYGLWLGMVGGLLPVAAYADPALFTEGFNFDTNGNTYLMPYELYTNRRSVEIGTLTGGIVLWAGKDEYFRGTSEGGVTMVGTPVSIVLQSNEYGQSERGSFSVWGGAEFYGSSSTNKPLFEVNNQYNTAAFDSVDVTVTNGSLSVGGSPVLTAGGLNAALSTAVPPASWSSAYVARGNVLGGAFATGAAQAWGVGSMAHGDEASAAYGVYSSAIGVSALTFGDFSSAHGSYVGAYGPYSWAQGWGSSSSGSYARAGGWNANADGAGATAMGMGVFARSYAETVVGSFNLIDASANYNNWIATDSAFRVGNGSSDTDKSDAVNIRKNGETTLTNKYWKANSSAPLADPSEPNDAGGSALVVDGHTTLNGKVVITVPQGDISMGIYQ